MKGMKYIIIQFVLALIPFVSSAENAPVPGWIRLEFVKTVSGGNVTFSCDAYINATAQVLDIPVDGLTPGLHTVTSATAYYLDAFRRRDLEALHEVVKDNIEPNGILEMGRLAHGELASSSNLKFHKIYSVCNGFIVIVTGETAEEGLVTHSICLTPVDNTFKVLLGPGLRYWPFTPIDFFMGPTFFGRSIQFQPEMELSDFVEFPWIGSDFCGDSRIRLKVSEQTDDNGKIYCNNLYVCNDAELLNEDMKLFRDFLVVLKQLPKEDFKASPAWQALEDLCQWVVDSSNIDDRDIERMRNRFLGDVKIEGILNLGSLRLLVADDRCKGTGNYTLVPIIVLENQRKIAPDIWYLESDLQAAFRAEWLRDHVYPSE